VDWGKPLTNRPGGRGARCEQDLEGVTDRMTTGWGKRASPDPEHDRGTKRLSVPALPLCGGRESEGANGVVYLGTGKGWENRTKKTLDGKDSCAKKSDGLGRLEIGGGVGTGARRTNK